MFLYNFARLIKNAISKDIGRKHDALRLFANMLFDDYRLAWANWDWEKDEKFNNHLDRFNERNGFNTHRRFQLKELLKLTVNIKGDTAECGVFTGASSYLICTANQKAGGGNPLNKKHLLFDSFEGISAPAKEDSSYWKKGDLSAGEEVVLENLKEFEDQLEFYKGWIPTRFSENRDREFSFVHIDVDLYEPTKASLEFFYDRLNNGGIILCDDYGSAFCPGATKAFDDFFTEKLEKPIALSGGAAFIIKGIFTAKEIL